MGIYCYHESWYAAPGSWKWKHPRKNIFILKVNSVEFMKKKLSGVSECKCLPKQANINHRIIDEFTYYSIGNFIGKTSKCQYSKERLKAEEILLQLKNEGHIVFDRKGWNI